MNETKLPFPAHDLYVSRVFKEVKFRTRKITFAELQQLSEIVGTTDITISGTPDDPESNGETCDCKVVCVNVTNF
jgi:hypothetical protein